MQESAHVFSVARLASGSQRSSPVLQPRRQHRAAAMLAATPQNDALLEESGSDSPAPVAPSRRAFSWRRAVVAAVATGLAVVVTASAGGGHFLRTSSLDAARQDWSFSSAFDSFTQGMSNAAGALRGAKAKAAEHYDTAKTYYNDTKQDLVSAKAYAQKHWKSLQTAVGGGEPMCGLIPCPTSRGKCCGGMCCANGCATSANLACWVNVTAHYNTAMMHMGNIYNQKGYCGLVPCPVGTCCGGMCCQNGCDPYAGVTCKVEMPRFLP